MRGGKNVGLEMEGEIQRAWIETIKRDEIECRWQTVGIRNKSGTVLERIFDKETIVTDIDVNAGGIQEKAVFAIIGNRAVEVVRGKPATYH